jgi:putative sugar O-methyltransferase
VSEGVAAGRLTFPRLASGTHPLADGSRVTASTEVSTRTPDAEDFAIAGDILRIHAQAVQRDQADGAWAWINQHKRGAYLEALRSGSTELLASVLAGMFRNDATWGLTTAGTFDDAFRSMDRRVALENQILLDLDTWQEFTKQDFGALSRIALSPQVGSPFGAVIDGHLICADQPRHDYFALKIRSLTGSSARPVILEIGGGYGGHALQLHRRIPQLHYIDCDLLEGLYVTYYFLVKTTGVRPEWIFEPATLAHATGSRFCLVPSDRAQSIHAHPDLVFNHGSLSEMARKTVSRYIDLIHGQWQPRYFLHQNANFLLFPDSERHLEILADEFPMVPDCYEEVSRGISIWQGAGGRYREFLFRAVRP